MVNASSGMWPKTRCTRKGELKRADLARTKANDSLRYRVGPLKSTPTTSRLPGTENLILARQQVLSNQAALQLARSHPLALSRPNLSPLRGSGKPVTRPTAGAASAGWRPSPSGIWNVCARPARTSRRRSTWKSGPSALAAPAPASSGNTSMWRCTAASQDAPARCPHEGRAR